MTVGEKIQYYRKNLHMSQDELGQKLNVSRQTVSLWETGQTMPTIDNLILLKEIFGVSVDVLLSLEEPNDKSESERVCIPPIESFSVNLNRKDFSVLRKQATRAIRFMMIVSIVLFVVLLGFEITEGDEHGSVLGVLFGLSIMSLAINIKSTVIADGNARRFAGKIVDTIYRYDMYEDLMILSLIRNNECVKTEKIYYKDIDKIHITKDYYVFVCSGYNWIIKRSALDAESFVEKIVKSIPRKKIVKTATSVWYVLSVVLNVISVSAVFIGTILLGVFDVVSEDVVRYFWVFALFLPFSIGSLVLGIYLKKTVDKGRPSMIIGIATTVVLVVLSAFTVVIPALSRNATDCLERVEMYTATDVPRYKSYNITNYASTSGKSKVARFTFGENNTKDFETSLMFSKEWMKSLPAEIEDVVKYGYSMDYMDYYFVYNLDTDELNTVPAEKGTYKFFNGYYDVETNQLIVVEFTYAFK